MKPHRAVALEFVLCLFLGCGGSTNSGSNQPPPKNPDFTLSASPSTLNISVGNSASVQVSVTATNGFADTVNVTATGLPNGVTVPSVNVAVGASATLTFSAGHSAATGTFNVILTGVSGALSHTAALALTVSPTISPDFAVSASPSKLTIAAGNSASVQVSVTAMNGFTGTVAVTASGLPNGVTAPSVNVAAGATVTFTFSAGSSAATGAFNVTLTGASGGISHTAALALTISPAVNPDFSLSAAPSSLQIARNASGTLQISINPQNGFTSAVTVAAQNLPTGVTSTPVTINAGSSGTLSLNVSVPTANGTFSISLTGTSGTVSHSTSVTLGISLGNGVLTIVPRTSGSNAFQSDVAAYLASMETDVAPARLAECGTASGSYTIEILYDPTVGNPEFDPSGVPLILYNTLPTPTSPSHFFDYNVHETAHALQYDLLHLLSHRGTHAEIEGFARGCTDLVYRSLGIAGKDAPKNGGDDRMLWMDTLRRVDPEILAAGGWSSSGPHVQPEQSLGEAVYLLTASRPVTAGVNGLIEHENAYFAAVPFPTTQNPPSPADRIKIWDSLSYHLDGQTPGAWMPSEMIQDPDFTPTIGTPQLIAWPEYPQFPAQMMVQAFVVTGTDGFNHPTVQPVTSGPVTITVKDTTGQTVLTLTPDLSETAQIAGYTPNLQTALPQGTYTVFANATVNGTPLESKFVIANIPFDKTGLGTNDLSFPGQYLVAVDSSGNANGGTLTATRGTLVWSMPGLAIVNPDSTGTFDITGPSGTSHTYTAPTPWARFIPVN